VSESKFEDWGILSFGASRVIAQQEIQFDSMNAGTMRQCTSDITTVHAKGDSNLYSNMIAITIGCMKRSHRSI
jgi:hypothetical protein